MVVPHLLHWLLLLHFPALPATPAAAVAAAVVGTVSAACHARG
jgi:hypothetical protein